MLDDGMGFSLAPWRPVIEQRLVSSPPRFELVMCFGKSVESPVPASHESLRTRRPFQVGNLSTGVSKELSVPGQPMR
ncbi:hypothetical protein [Alloalcanivorax dieselolei]|uniref:hypothetical protein n=1 Tax=Alloalcanivorax dieselolei TaxID=285091 RepID=UPI001ED98958|nr:hypothetical protein [Alloalcanivorax dieselolei]